MLTKYIQAAMGRAKYEILKDDKSYYGEIAGFRGVWANAATLERCRNDLAEVLEEWLLLRISSGLKVPAVSGIRLKVPKSKKVA